MEFYTEEKTWEEIYEDQSDFYTIRGIRFSKEWNPDFQKFDYKANGLLIDEEYYPNIISKFD